MKVLIIFSRLLIILVGGELTLEMLCCQLVVQFEFDISFFSCVLLSRESFVLGGHGSVEAGQSLVSFAVAFLSESFTAFSALERSIVPVSPEMVHHVANFGEVSLTETADEHLVHAFSLLVVHSPTKVMELFRFDVVNGL
jgi:hypothetical protein